MSFIKKIQYRKTKGAFNSFNTMNSVDFINPRKRINR